MVTARTIANCYRHCGFTELPSNVTDDESKDDDIPLSKLVRLRNVNMGACINVDIDLLTCSELTDGDFIEDLFMARNTVS